MRLFVSGALLGVAASTAASVNAEAKQESKTFRACLETYVKGLGANAADSLRNKDFRVYESNNPFDGRFIPRIACKSRKNEDRLISRGGIYYSDVLSSSCKIPKEKIWQYADAIKRYNQKVGLSANFQIATGCRGANDDEAARSYKRNSSFHYKTERPVKPLNEAAWMAKINAVQSVKLAPSMNAVRVGVRLWVAENGRVSRCQAYASSNITALDKAACDGMLRYARFRPASDRYGDLVGAQYSTAIVYRARPKSR